MTTASTVTATIGDPLYQATLADDLAHTEIAAKPEELHGSNTSPTPTGLWLSSLGARTASIPKKWRRPPMPGTCTLISATSKAAPHPDWSRRISPGSTCAGLESNAIECIARRNSGVWRCRPPPKLFLRRGDYA